MLIEFPLSLEMSNEKPWIARFGRGKRIWISEFWSVDSNSRHVIDNNGDKL